MFLKGKRTGFLEGVQTVSDCSVYKSIHKKRSRGIRKNRKEGVLPIFIILPASPHDVTFKEIGSLQSILENT